MYLKGREPKELLEVKSLERKAIAPTVLKLPELKLTPMYSSSSRALPSNLSPKSKVIQTRTTPTMKLQLKLPQRTKLGYLQNYAVSSKVARELTAELKPTVRRLPKKAISPYVSRKVVWRKAHF
jgi:hypothetical protein